MSVWLSVRLSVWVCFCRLELQRQPVNGQRRKGGAFVSAFQKVAPPPCTLMHFFVSLSPVPQKQHPQSRLLQSMVFCRHVPCHCLEFCRSSDGIHEIACMYSCKWEGSALVSGGAGTFLAATPGCYPPKASELCVGQAEGRTMRRSYAWGKPKKPGLIQSSNPQPQPSRMQLALFRPYHN